MIELLQTLLGIFFLLVTIWVSYGLLKLIFKEKTIFEQIADITVAKIKEEESKLSDVDRQRLEKEILPIAQEVDDRIKSVYFVSYPLSKTVGVDFHFDDGIYIQYHIPNGIIGRYDSLSNTDIHDKIKNILKEQKIRREKS